MCSRVTIPRLWLVLHSYILLSTGLSMLIVTGTISGCGGGVLLRYLNLLCDDTPASPSSSYILVLSLNTVTLLHINFLKIWSDPLCIDFLFELWIVLLKELSFLLFFISIYWIHLDLSAGNPCLIRFIWDCHLINRKCAISSPSSL